MKTPFEILEIAEDSDDSAVKKGYLRLVKRYPPERYPVEFQRICAAYECVKTEKDRLKFSLFDTTCPDVDELIHDVRSSGQEKRPDFETMCNLLVVSVQQAEIAE